MSLEYHSASHPPDQPDMKNRARSDVAFLCCLWIRHYQTWSALRFRDKSSIWTSPGWLNMKRHALIEHKESVKFYIQPCSLKKKKIVHALSISWIMSFSLDLHPLQSFGTHAITNCSICKRSKCGSKATQLSISIKLPPVTCLLSHQ